MLALEAHLRVDAVLEHEEVARDRELGEARAALRREVAAGGVLAGGLQRAELHLVAGEHPLERVHVEAVLVHRDADHARTGGPQRRQGADEGRGLRDDHVARLEQRARHQVDALAGARGDDDLVGLRRPSALGAEKGDLLPQLVEALGAKVGDRVATLLAEHVRRDLRQRFRGVDARRRPAGGHREHARLVGQAEGVVQDLLAVGQGPVGERVDLPVVAMALVGGRGERPHERATAHAGGHIAELRQPPVHPRGGEVVDAGLLGQRPRGGQLLARIELAGVDGGHDAVHQLLGQRYI